MQDTKHVKRRTEAVKAPTLTCLDHRSLDHILSYLDDDSLKQIRLTNKDLKTLVDSKVTFFRFGVYPGSCGPLYPDLKRVEQLWPGIKTIKASSLHSLSSEKADEMISFGHYGFDVLAATSWTAVEVLDLSYCALAPRGVAGLGACFERWTGLRKLNLKSNAMELESLSRLSSNAFPMLESLNLSHNKLGGDAGPLLAKLISRCPKLRELDLSSNTITAETMGHVMKVELPLLEDINLAENELQIGGGALGGARWPCLRRLNLATNELDDVAFEGICKGAWPLLEELVLNENPLVFLGDRDRGATALRQAACGVLYIPPRWPHLRRLELEVVLDDVEYLHILFGATWKALQHLSVAVNDTFSVLGTRNLASVASHLPALTCLDLRATGMYAEAISELLSVSWNKLERLELGYDEMKPEPFEALAAGMERNRLPALKILEFDCIFNYSLDWRPLLRCNWPTLEELIMNGCSIGINGAIALAEAAERLPKLHTLFLKENEDHPSVVITPNTWYGGFEGITRLLRAPWPALKAITFEYANLYNLEQLPQGFEGWKVTANAEGWSANVDKGGKIVVTNDKRTDY